MCYGLDVGGSNHSRNSLNASLARPSSLPEEGFCGSAVLQALKYGASTFRFLFRCAEGIRVWIEAADNHRSVLRCSDVFPEEEYAFPRTSSLRLRLPHPYLAAEE